MEKNQHRNQVQSPLPLPQPIQLDQSRVVVNHEKYLVRDYVNLGLAPVQPAIIYQPFR